MTIDTSIIISTYNSPDWLAKVLFGYNNQSYRQFEIVIADDGSKQETFDLIETIKKEVFYPIVHVWHEDNGFQKASILNKAIAQAKGDYIIQADGDCILHPYFVKDHFDMAKENTYVFGSRVNILEEALDSVFKQQKTNFSAFSKGIKNRTRALRIPFLSRFYKPETTISRKFRGCNTSFFKKDFIAVNGYDENFKGWGREDSELMTRFHNNGILAQRIRYRGIVYHIFHNIKSKDQLEKNNDIENLTVKNKLKRCSKGINTYLNEA
jgi:glycosyltransferase involved in cell wall biosynthesis